MSVQVSRRLLRARSFVHPTRLQGQLNIIHQAMKVTEDLSGEILQGASTIEVVGVCVSPALTHSKPGVSGEVEGIRWHWR